MSSCPVASPTATTSVRGRSPASRPRWSRLRGSPATAARPRDLQRLQILCEARLLPGVLQPNRSLSFVCRDVGLTVERTKTPSPPLRARPDAHDSGQARRRLLVRAARPVEDLEANGQVASGTRPAEPERRGRRVAGVLNAEATVRTHAASGARGRPAARPCGRRARPGPRYRRRRASASSQRPGTSNPPIRPSSRRPPPSAQPSARASSSWSPRPAQPLEVAGPERDRARRAARGRVGDGDECSPGLAGEELDDGGEPLLRRRAAARSPRRSPPPHAVAAFVPCVQREGRGRACL